MRMVAWYSNAVSHLQDRERTKVKEREIGMKLHIMQLTKILTLLTSAFTLISRIALAQAEHERLTTNAWARLKTNPPDHAGAITNAEKCIAEFKEAAKDMQEKLEREQPRLPIGSATPETKEKIFANGPLNDVATCYFIVGEAHRLLISSDNARIKLAKQAYEEARHLSFARCWDTNGWFWSPAEEASRRLRILPSVPSGNR
jgi:hypothetical protein